MTTVIRPGQRVIHIPGIGVRTSRRAVSAGGAGNWWEAGGASGAVAVYQPKGAASLDASYTNLANPGTYDAAPGVAPTWDAATGWGITTAGGHYLTTGIVPASGWSLLVRYSNVARADIDLAGAQQGGTAIGVAPRTTSDYRYYNNGSYVGVTTYAAAGVMAVAGQDGYFDGVDEANIGTASWAGFTTTIYVGRRNGQAGSCNANIQAIAIYSSVLTAGEVAAVSAAMAAL